MGGPLETTLDADFLLTPYDKDVAELLTESIGDESFFYKRFGYYLDVLLPAITENLPSGWESRLVPLPGYEHLARCLEPHDSVVAKLFAGRPKDMALIAHLLGTGRINALTVHGRLRGMRMNDKQVVHTHLRLKQAVAMAGMPPMTGEYDDVAGTVILGSTGVSPAPLS